MKNLKEIFKNRNLNYKKMVKYGFIRNKENYTYKKLICNEQFEVQVLASQKIFISKVIDVSNYEEYILVDIEDSVGEFVGKVKYEYENLIKDIIEKCTDFQVFKNHQSKEIIKYIKNKYNDDLEFLWEKSSDSAICRNKMNNKWYSVFMVVGYDKLKLNLNDNVEIIDLKYQKNEIKDIVDNEKIFPGYHMNKSSWITIILDGRLDLKSIFKLIDNSYKLSIGTNKTGLSGDYLSNKVYNYLLTIPKGKVVTYGQIGKALGNKGLARVVGSILHKNPDGNKYPCYKVLNGKGELAEEFVFGGKKIQKQLLEKDGIKVENNRVDLNIYQWQEE